ncbi:MAG TPA: hypothetical protein VGA02_04040 [Gemmatimonadales bacterium]|jgi:hypothetical protein
MGLYDQPNSWQCGPFALKHGLLAHGVFVHEADITKVAGTTETDGTDDRQLARAAQAFGGVLQCRRYRTAFGARRALRRLLAAQVPVLLCVDQWDHWVTAVGADAQHVAVLDSHYDTVVRLEPWGPFVRRIRYRDPRGGWLRRLPVYDLHPLAVRGETGLRLVLTPDRARRVLQAPASVRGALDDYAQRLAPFAARNGPSSGAVPLASFLADRTPDLTAQADAAAVASFALAAEVFGIRCDPAGLRDVVRVVRESGRTAAPAVTHQPQQPKALAAAS